MSADYSGMENILEDIERSDAVDAEAGGETDLDRPMSRLSVKQPSARLDKAPTADDLMLGQRVLILEKERDSLAAELEALKTKRHPSASSATIPSPRLAEANPGATIEVPHDMISVLHVLRHHITELSRDNHALRYTFGLDTASSSSVTLDAPGSSKGKNVDKREVDLEAIVRRVRELVRENEELGDLVVEAGKASTEEWQRALDESKKVITSLDNDLQHHFDTVQSLREQLDAYITHFGPLPSATRPSGGGGNRGARGHSIQPSSPRSSQGGRQSKDKDRRGGRQSAAGGHHGSDGRDRRDRDRDRDRHRDGDRDRDQGGRGGTTGRGGDRTNGFGQGGRREDDRASKRRR